MTEVFISIQEHQLVAKTLNAPPHQREVYDVDPIPLQVMAWIVVIEKHTTKPANEF